MKPLSIAGALALTLSTAACGENSTTGQNNRTPAGADAAANSAQPAYSAAGNVTAVVGNQVTIAHGPVEALGWPAMTMTFRAAEPAMLQGIGVGDRVAFQFRQSGNDYTLTELRKAS